MRKTGGQVEDDFCVLIGSSALDVLVTGQIYKDGMRPLNAKTEDIVVSFFTGLDGEIQEGFVNVNIYVPDVDNSGSGLIKDSARCKVIEAAANDLFLTHTLFGDYHIALASMIKTFKVEDVKQHFINCKIYFRLSTF